MNKTYEKPIFIKTMYISIDTMAVENVMMMAGSAVVNSAQEVARFGIDGCDCAECHPDLDEGVVCCGCPS